jgi:hypothetical protein
MSIDEAIKATPYLATKKIEKINTKITASEQAVVAVQEPRLATITISNSSQTSS